MGLTFPHCCKETEAVGKRVNRGGGYGLGTPVRYNFLGPVKTLDLLKKILGKVKKRSLNVMFLNV